MQICHLERYYQSAELSLEDTLVITGNFILCHCCAHVAIFMPQRYLKDWTLSGFFVMGKKKDNQDIDMHLFETGGIIGPAMEAQGKRFVFGSNEEIAKELDVDLAWMDGKTMIVAMDDDPHPLAMIMLFVDAPNVKVDDMTREMLPKITKTLGDRLRFISKIRHDNGDWDSDENGEMESGVEM